MGIKVIAVDHELAHWQRKNPRRPRIILGIVHLVFLHLARRKFGQRDAVEHREILRM